MVEKLGLRTGRGQSPLVQAFFSYLAVHSGDLGDLYNTDADSSVAFGPSQLQSYHIPQLEGQFDIALELVDTGGGLTGVLKYNGEALDCLAAEQMAADYCRLLDLFIDDPGQTIDTPLEIASRGLGRENLLL